MNADLLIPGRQSTKKIEGLKVWGREEMTGRGINGKKPGLYGGGHLLPSAVQLLFDHWFSLKLTGMEYNTDT
jgi:hypothetical protein